RRRSRDRDARLLPHADLPADARPLPRRNGAVDTAAGGSYREAGPGAPRAVLLDNAAVTLGPRRAGRTRDPLRFEHLPGAQLSLRYRRRAALALPADGRLARAAGVPDLHLARGGPKRAGGRRSLLPHLPVRPHAACFPIDQPRGRGGGVLSPPVGNR